MTPAEKTVIDRARVQKKFDAGVLVIDEALDRLEVSILRLRDTVSYMEGNGGWGSVLRGAKHHEG